MSNLPLNIHQAIREAYWKDLMHLCELGLVDLTPDGKGVRITNTGKTLWAETEGENRAQPKDE